MAVDIYLVIPPAPANPPISADPVTDQYFKSTFSNQSVVEIRQFSLGVENKASIGSATAGAGAGKAVLNELLIEKSVDTMSRSLFALAATGGHLAKMQVYLRKTGAAGGKPYLAYGFNTVYLSKIDWSVGSGDDQPIEHLTFAYGALALGYYPQKPDGTLGTVVKTSWSQITNTEAPPDILASF
jgi:type VI secretion system secreted protein Hcp